MSFTIDPQKLPVFPSYQPLFTISNFVLVSSLTKFSSILASPNISVLVIIVPVVTFALSSTLRSLLPDVIFVWNLNPVGAESLMLAPFNILTSKLIVVKSISLFNSIVASGRYAISFVLS